LAPGVSGAPSLICRVVEEANSGSVLAAARVRWEGNQCFSLDSEDRYFSPDGVAEVARVFMAPVNLEKRFAAATDIFTCAELGFGTGLSAMTLAQRFCAVAPDTAHLHLISFERAPLSQRDMHAMSQRWQHQLPLYQDLLRLYPPGLSGWHRLHLCGGRVRLSLYFGEASDGLDDIRNRQKQPVDHWLLDGFAPTKNPSLWSPELLGKVGALATKGSTLATYSAVGRVRHGNAPVRSTATRTGTGRWYRRGRCGSRAG